MNPTARERTILRHPGPTRYFRLYAGVLEGFTIDGSNTVGEAGGVTALGSATIRFNVIDGTDGSGVTAVDSSRVLYNVIRGNHPCGAIGSAQGGGIYARGNALVMGNIVEDNYGLCDYNCYPAPQPGTESADPSALRGGGPLQGGGIFALDDVRIVSNLFRRNCAESGAGIYLFGNAVAVNNTVLANHGEGASLSGTTTFANNIVAFNVNVGVQVYSGTPTIDNNLFWANGGGDGFTGTDPILSDPQLAPDDVRLRPSSPAIDAGDDAWVLDGDLDIQRQPRVAGDHVDVGADEFLRHALQAANSDSPGLVLHAPAPSPRTGSGEATFRFTLPEAAQVSLAIHDVLGRRVAVRPAEPRTAGEQSVTWDPGPLAAGYYFVRLTTETGAAATTPWIVLR